jgi:hypothetical protein
VRNGSLGHLSPRSSPPRSSSASPSPPASPSQRSSSSNKQSRLSTAEIQSLLVQSNKE